MGKLFYVMGKSASGKDTIFQMLTKNDMHYLHRVIPYTTRPMRAGEEPDVAYHFADDKAFEEMKARGKVIESRTYQTVMGPWHYYTADDGQFDFSKGHSIMIGTLESYMQVKAYFGDEYLVPIYVEVEDGLRLSRALARERQQAQPNYKELCRRFIADSEDFSEEKLAEAGITRRYINNDLETCCQEIIDKISETDLTS